MQVQIGWLAGAFLRKNKKNEIFQTFFQKGIDK
jgi:hypothetical protein